jgi:mannosyl-3-phosphoglycerate phosphatase
MGLTAVQGGRFLTISRGASKASRIADLCGWWARETRSERVLSLSLGDAENDIAMLQTTDFGVIVANGAHPPLKHLDGEEQGRIIRTTREGPEGWNEAVLDFIQRHHEGQQA